MNDKINDIGNRIKRVRQDFKLKQNEFSARIGLSQNTVTNYETSRRNPSNQVILSICREFSVNEYWLRTGEGEPYSTMTEDEELAAYAAEITMNDDDFIKQLVLNYMKLPEEGKAVIRNLFKSDK